MSRAFGNRTPGKRLRGNPMWLSALLAMLFPLHTAAAEASKARLARLEVAVVRAEDVRTIKKLQRAYGY